MAGVLPLDWAILAVSLFNTVLLSWLGLAVLLNAERRTWGIWLAGGGLLLGATFFVSHSAILGYGLHYEGPGTNFWWHVGWVPVISLPLAWYVVMLWYSGYWERPQARLRRRQRPWLWLAGLTGAGLAALFVVANPLPSFRQVARLELAATPGLGGIPLVILVYPLYIVLCIALSLDALRRPEPSARVMGDLARRRARPWLAAAAVVLLLVSLLVGGVLLWIVLEARQRAPYDVYASMSLAVAWFDLAIESLIGLAVLLLGQAIVAYEVFTGQALPRRGLLRHWRRTVLLAAGYGLAVGWTLSVGLRPIYGLLATALLMTLFYALLSRHDLAAREQAMAHLRPFVATPRLYEHLLAPLPSETLDLDVQAQFQTLCAAVLGAGRAYLAPLGPFKSLVGQALAYPPGGWPSPPPLAGLAAGLEPARPLCLPLDPARWQGATWAVPLWSARGLDGVLLMGEKRDGGLYTQEEIELAQASGERLLDTLAGVELARRLLALQRQRLAESRDYGELSRALFDQRARRLLHDEVLPLLHAALLEMGGLPGRDESAAREVAALLADAHRQVSGLLRELPAGTPPAIDRLGLAGALRDAAEGELAGALNRLEWEVDDSAEARARALAPLPAEVLFYAGREALRNAARHGRGADPNRPLHVCAGLGWRPPAPGGGTGRLELWIEDDGVGPPPDTLLGHGQPAGHGLDLHGTMLTVVGGSLAVDRLAGKRTRVTMTVPCA